MADAPTPDAVDTAVDRLAQLSADSFRDCLNQTFQITVPGLPEPLATELVDVRGLGGYTEREDRQPFSLLFRGPADAPLQQGIYQLENETLGALSIFLVTVGPDPKDRDMRYEAVFT